MRQQKTISINANEVHGYARSWVDEFLKLENHGPKCTALRIVALLLKAAARMCSLDAARLAAGNRLSHSEVFFTQRRGGAELQHTAESDFLSLLAVFVAVNQQKNLRSVQHF